MISSKLLQKSLDMDTSPLKYIIGQSYPLEMGRVFELHPLSKPNLGIPPPLGADIVMPDQMITILVLMSDNQTWRGA